jgi:integrase
MRKPPKKPYPEFPLFAHPNGQWCKKIKGRHEYFGRWDDPDAALDKYLRDVVYLQAGKTPPGEQATVADLLDAYCDHKERLRDAGEITPQTYDDYFAVCKVIADTLGKHRPVAAIGFDDLSQIRAALSKGKNGKVRGASSIKRLLTMARMVFLFGNEELGHSVRYKKALRSPSARVMRDARNKVGERLFTAAEIRDLVQRARPQLKAMILLGINSGFGNDDCGSLQIEALEDGWHRHPRPKTGMKRRCPLWPETVKAINAVVGDRTSGLVFVTKYGNPWTTDGRRDPIAYEFRKLMGPKHRTGVTTFYTLRRTFETIAGTADVNQFVVDALMGHVADARDMSAVYRQRVFDDQLRKCVEYVRLWYLGKVRID